MRDVGPDVLSPRFRRPPHSEPLLPADAYGLLRERAREAGLAEPRVVGDALNGNVCRPALAFLPPARARAYALDEAWARRAAEATAEIRWPSSTSSARAGR